MFSGRRRNYGKVYSYSYTVELLSQARRHSLASDKVVVLRVLENKPRLMNYSQPYNTAALKKMTRSTPHHSITFEVLSMIIMNNLFKTYENKFEKSPSAKASPGMIWKAHKFKKRLKYSGA